MTNQSYQKLRNLLYASYISTVNLQLNGNGAIGDFMFHLSKK